MLVCKDHKQWMASSIFVNLEGALKIFAEDRGRALTQGC